MAHAVSLGLHVILLIVFKGPLTLKVPKFLPISLLLAIFFFVMVLKKVVVVMSLHGMLST